MRFHTTILPAALLTMTLTTGATASELDTLSGDDGSIQLTTDEAGSFKITLGETRRDVRGLSVLLGVDTAEAAWELQAEASSTAEKYGLTIESTALDGETLQVLVYGVEQVPTGSELFTVSTGKGGAWLWLDDARAADADGDEVQITETSREANWISDDIQHAHDINQDSSVDILDAMLVLGEVLGEGTCPVPADCDLDGDDSVDVTDLQRVLGSVMTGGLMSDVAWDDPVPMMQDDTDERDLGEDKGGVFEDALSFTIYDANDEPVDGDLLPWVQAKCPTWSRRTRYAYGMDVRVVITGGPYPYGPLKLRFTETWGQDVSHTQTALQSFLQQSGSVTSAVMGATGTLELDGVVMEASAESQHIFQETSEESSSESTTETETWGQDMVSSSWFEGWLVFVEYAIVLDTNMRTYTWGECSVGSSTRWSSSSRCWRRCSS